MPKQEYVLKDGVTKVPGVTTVLEELGWNKRVLMGWARKQAMAGVDPNKLLKTAGDIGSIVHLLIEAHIKHKIATTPLTDTLIDLAAYDKADIDKANIAFSAYLDWEASQQITYISAEQKLVSEANRTGGTLDIVAKRGDKLLLLDAKSGKSIYDENKIQVATYGEFYKEVFGVDIDEVWLIHIDKESGNFDDVMLTEEERREGFEVFKLCRALRDLHWNFDKRNPYKQRKRGDKNGK